MNSEQLLAVLKTVSGWVWGAPLILLLLGTGLFLTFRLGGIQFRGFWPAFRLAFFTRSQPGAGDISHFQSLMTALSATVGTGNIVGVALAISAGGPGALFWMWITGLVGMATKYTEAVLAVEYRTTDARGRMAGGPMYYLSRGLPRFGRIPAVLFAVFGMIASFGIGNMTQAQAVSNALEKSFEIPPETTAVALTFAAGLVILGGIKSIARVTSVIVPIMILFYMGAGLLVLGIEADRIPAAFALIFESAFSPMAAAGGFAGAALREVIQSGVSRGIFSNESGLGSAPIAAAAARTEHPVPQALVSMTQTFIDTLIVCTVTGLVILTSGAWLEPGILGDDRGAKLTQSAFESGLGGLGADIVAVSLVFFAYSTVLGWSYYGEKCTEYLFGEKAALPYRLVFTALIAVGALATLDIVWTAADIMNGLMALPNLIGLLLLSGVAARITKQHFEAQKRGTQA